MGHSTFSPDPGFAEPDSAMPRVDVRQRWAGKRGKQWPGLYRVRCRSVSLVLVYRRFL